MPLVTFYFELHQPFRLHPDSDKFLWEENNRQIFEKVAKKNYLPATKMLTQLVKDIPEFKITFSMSGTFLEQAQLYQVDVIDALQELLDAGKANNQVEYLEETYYHSLTSLFQDPVKKEFKDQVSLHRQKMKELFGIKPTAFRNTELMFNNEIANVVADMDFVAMLCEQRDDMYTPQDGKPISSNAVFRLKGRKGKSRHLIILPRNRHLSDDVAFRFKNHSLSAQDYADHIGKIDGEAVLLGYDYEHIGEHLWADSGIFEFWQELAAAVSRHPHIAMANPSEIAKRFRDADCPLIDIHPLATSSWADMDRDTFGWIGSQTQYNLFQDLENLETDIRKSGPELLERWRHLTTSDHLYYLHEGKGADRSVHDYFSPYGSLAAATFVLTRKIDNLQIVVKNFLIHKKTQKTPIILITPETGRLPTQGMGEFARYISGKSGGLGEVVSALCRGFVERQIPVHIITLNLKRRFREEARMNEKDWITSRHRLDPQNIHLVSSSLFEDNSSAYDGNPRVTAAEFQTQIINTYIKEIRSDYDGHGILHSHDWMAGGAITAYARARDIPVLHTIHNTHTGQIPLDMFHGLNVARLSERFYQSWDQGRLCIDTQATAIKNASKINYVGKTFLKEIVKDYFLDRPIIPWSVREETKVKYYENNAVVIPNGISPDVYPENQPENPAVNQTGLARSYGPDDKIIEAKKDNLVKFQKKLGLSVDPEAILLYWPSRLDASQKGIELLEDIAVRFVKVHKDAQIVVIGNAVGDKSHEEIMGRLACVASGRIAYQRFDSDLSILGYAAASDVFGASLYEPFGQIDVVGNLYGATATNRDTGGYTDKIEPLSLKAWGAPQDLGNGVLFKNYDSGGLWWGLETTVKNHRYFRKNPGNWEKQARRIMKEARKNWSLENMVAGYITVYEDPNENRPLV